MTIFENFLKSELNTEFEIKLQLTSFNSSGRILVQNRKMFLKIKLNCMRTNKILFSLLEDIQNFKFGGI